MANKYVGQRVKRTEDPRLIKGLAHYVDDIELPNTLHVAFVRSYYAHAKITGIDTSASGSTTGSSPIFVQFEKKMSAKLAATMAWKP